MAVSRPRRIFRDLIAAVCVAFLSTPSWVLADPELTDVERESLRMALAAINAGEPDLGFEKDVGEPQWALPWVRDVLRNPLAVHQAASRLWQIAQGDGETNALWVLMADWLAVSNVPVSADAKTEGALDTGRLAPALAEALDAFCVEAQRAYTVLEQAFAGLSRDQREDLALAVLGSVVKPDSRSADAAALERAGIRREKIDRSIAERDALDAKPAQERFLSTALLVDFDALLEAGRMFIGAVKSLADQGRRIEMWPQSTTILNTPLGDIVVLGPDRVAWEAPALLVLDPGGDRLYGGGAAHANGLLGRPFGAIVDLGGNDVYGSSDLIGSPAGALFGIAVVVDAAGDDVYRADYLGSAAAAWGVAWLEDRQGNDTYAVRALGQAAAVGGVALLIDGAGNDRYSLGWCGQGYAGWRGFGLLLDREGHDLYRAGGEEPDHGRNPGRFLSLAQGFSIGIRPISGGGIGALVDLEGNDVYLTDVFGQGAAYYYSAGFLLDGTGHDLYVSHHYGQGCGVHMGNALLADLEGDDRYLGGILAQGAAHDFSVAALLDRDGNDQYSATRHAQGHGMNNAVGWLIDGSGDDRYDAQDPSVCQGVGNTGGFRESGSIGLLIDLGGQDRYAVGFPTEGRIAVRPLFGAILDRKEGRGP